MIVSDMATKVGELNQRTLIHPFLSTRPIILPHMRTRPLEFFLVLPSREDAVKEASPFLNSTTRFLIVLYRRQLPAEMNTPNWTAEVKILYRRRSHF